MSWRRKRGRIGAALAALLVVGACNPPTQSPSTPVASEPASAAIDGRQDLPDEQRSPDLFGAWLVEMVAAPGPLRMGESGDTVLLVGVHQLELLSQCITIGPFDYGRVMGRIRVRQQAVQPLPPQASPAPAPVVCARTLTPAERKLGPLLLAAREVRRQEDGSVSISGSAGSLILRRPSGPLVNPRGEVPAPRVPPLIGAWRFVSIGGRPVPFADRMELLLRPHRLEWRSGCVSQAKELRVEAGRLIPGEEDPFPICERGRSEAELAAERLFAGPVAARMGEDGRLRLEGSGIVAELEPLKR